jgi:hypothetical protein
MLDSFAFGKEKLKSSQADSLSLALNKREIGRAQSCRLCELAKASSAHRDSDGLWSALFESDFGVCAILMQSSDAFRER